MTTTVDKPKESPYGELKRIISKGLSWVENLCQKVEKLRRENDIVKKIFALVNELNQSDDDISPFSDTTLVDDAALEDSEKKRTFDGIILDEKNSCYENMESIIGVKVIYFEHDGVVDLAKENDAIEKLGIIEVEKISCSPCEVENVTGTSNISGIGIEENASAENLNCVEQNPTIDFVEDLYEATLPDDPLLSGDKYSPTDKSKNLLTTREYIYESFSDGIPAHQTDSVPLSAFLESLNSYDREEESNNHSFSTMVDDDINDYGDVKFSYGFDALKIIDDFCDDTLKDKISKEKLEGTLLPRLGSSRDGSVVNDRDDLQSQALSDSDWELV